MPDVTRLFATIALLASLRIRPLFPTRRKIPVSASLIFRDYSMDACGLIYATARLAAGMK